MTEVTGTLSVTGNSLSIGQYLDGRTLRLSGTGSYDGAQLRLRPGGVLEITATGVLSLVDGADIISWNGYGSQLIQIAGTLQRVGGTGSSYIDTHDYILPCRSSDFCNGLLRCIAIGRAEDFGNRLVTSLSRGSGGMSGLLLPGRILPQWQRSALGASKP